MYEIVHTTHYYDIGLLLEEDADGKPLRIRARYTDAAPYAEYGGLHCTTWFRTGIYMTEKEWEIFTRDKYTHQIKEALDSLKSPDTERAIQAEKIQADKQALKQAFTKLQSTINRLEAPYEKAVVDYMNEWCDELNLH